MYKNKYQDARMAQLLSATPTGKVFEVSEEERRVAKEFMLEVLKRNGIVEKDATIENTLKDVDEVLKK